jgi:predicted nucleic acid-binding Zn ribbon protein
MIYAVVLILILAVIAAVAWPLLNPPKPSPAAERELSPDLEELASQRDTAYRAISELEFDHQLGNLSQQDYQSLRERYRAEAAGIMQQLERAREPEKEAVAATRTVSSRVGRARKAPEALTDRRACPACGKAVPAGDRFCWHCGAALDRVCPTCQRPRPSGDAFCGACGTRLEGSV